MINVANLNRGDIIICWHEGLPYHAAIFCPQPDRIGNIIHAGSGFKRSGATLGTIGNLFNIHLHTINKTGRVKIEVYRNRQELGEKIAKQAEHWLLQGVTYDERRLLDTMEKKDRPSAIDNEDEVLCIFEYLKFAARSDTSPVKTPFYPHPGASVSSVIGSFFAPPSLGLSPRMVGFGLNLMRRGTSSEPHIKGFSCVGFVLACIGATALKDEIGPVTPESGWVSLKYGAPPAQQNTPYAEAWKIAHKKLGSPVGSSPGLDTLLTSEQQANFDLERLKNKLSFLAKLHPHRPDATAFLEGLQNSGDVWQPLGELAEIPMGLQEVGASKPFDKTRYHEEQQHITTITIRNHQAFGRTFGASAFRHSYQPSLFKKMLPWITGECVSDISSSISSPNR